MSTEHVTFPQGLRFAGGTQLTKCCGSEAIPPEPDDRIPDHVESGCVTDENDIRWPHEDEYGDEVTLVCPSCGRTWADEGCEHENVQLFADSTTQRSGRRNNSESPKFEPSNPTITDGGRWFTGECTDCGTHVQVFVEITDATVEA